MNGAPLLAVEGLSARAGREARPILRGVSLTVARGEVHGLVGESGAGKSTLAKAVLGILPPGVALTAGRMAFEGEDLVAMSPRRRAEILGRDITLIPQDPLTALNPGRRIEAQLTDGLRLKRGLGRAEARRRALELLDEVMIRDPERVMRAFPHELSGGMRQRVLIASAFAVEPKLVVADEPTTALDVTVQKEILRLIRSLQARHGTGVVFVTHDLGVVAKICDRVTLLYMGTVVEQGTAAEMFTAPTHPYTRALVAASPRYDRPDAGLNPVPEKVFSDLRAAISVNDTTRSC